MDLKTEQLEKLTNAQLGNIPEDILVEPEIIRYKSFDGLQIPALFYKPKNINHVKDKKIGAVLLIHGGSVDQERPIYSYEGVYQYLLNKGIAVMAPNFRGSTGYGKDFEKRYFMIGVEVNLKILNMPQNGFYHNSNFAVSGPPYDDHHDDVEFADLHHLSSIQT
jgi:hypothetical protein